MLGTSSGLPYTTINDFQSAKDYLTYLFSGIKGWICRGQISPEYRQSMFRYNGLMNKTYDGQDDVYISMNTFYLNDRLAEHVKRLNALYVDIDCYKVGYDKETVLYILEEEYFNNLIPCPTFVIDSGRGLYLIWKLQNEDRNALPRWAKVQEHFVSLLKEFGADPACKDSARILRIPYSINTKSHTAVKIIRFCDVTYKISDIQNEYSISLYQKKNKNGKKSYPYNTATEAMRRYAVDLALKLGAELPDFNDFLATQNWIAKMRIKKTETSYPHREDNGMVRSDKICRILQGYCDDIITLFSMREGADCKREIALFLYRLFTYDITEDRELALKKTLAFNASLSCPFPEDYVIRATQSAERKIDKGDTYHYKCQTIIDILEITNEEMQNLVYLVNDKRRKERKKDNNRRAYINKITAEGKITKKEAKENRRKQIIVYLEEGKTAKEVMTLLNISRATYYRELAIITAGAALEAAREKINEVKEKITETTINAVEIALEAAEATAEVNTVSIKTKGGVCLSAPVIGVSKIQPYNYKRSAQHCRTAPVALTNGVYSTLSVFVDGCASTDDSVSDDGWDDS